ncbi:STAS domain-containing protein [Ampullimonas aquatilis]|uniref:STAS domain-containing protein n=1 Tax=Ampullimonas aquatilis TaxID=1341549 RepID=UPI003C73BAE9
MTTITLGKDVTVNTAAQVLQTARAALSKSDVAPQIDLAETTRFDSALLSVLMALERDAKARGLAIQFSNAEPAIKALTRVYGLESVLVV